MLPILVQHLPRDRERMGLSEGHMAWLLGITRPQYRELEAGRLHITNELYERIVELCGSPR
jgi:predicted transcriptional regulator